MWDYLQDVCLVRAKELLGVTKGQHFIDKETWWWNKDTKKAVREKKMAFQA